MIFGLIFLGDDCRTENGQKCIFPFDYQGKTYHKCTSNDYDNDQPWCAYEVDRTGTLIEDEWGNCDAACTCPLGWEGKNCDIESKFQ